MSRDQKNGALMQRLLISVIVPIYRAEDYLVTCIESILKQTYRQLQIILVEDGSDDSSGEICDDYARRDERIIVLHKEKNEGLVAARHSGLSLAQGDYVGFVDADDWIEPTMFEYLINKAMKYDCDIVTSGRIEEFENKSVVCPNKLEEGIYTGEKLVYLFSKMISDCSGHLFNIFPTVWDKILLALIIFL